MKYILNNILVLAIATSFGFASCKKQKDNLDLGGSKGGEKTYDCPTLKKNFREDCETKEGDAGFVNADCECQKRNLESGDEKGRGDKEDDDKEKDDRGDKDRDKKDKKDRDKKDKKDWDKKDKDDRGDKEDDDKEKDNTGRG